MYGHNEKCTCVFCGEGRRVMGAGNGTDQRLDLIIQQNNRRIEQLDELIGLGKRAIAAIQDVLSPADAQPEAVEVTEPARRKRTK